MPEVIERQECLECGAERDKTHRSSCPYWRGSPRHSRVTKEQAVTVRYVRERQPVPVTEAAREVIRVARAGNWEGPEIPDPVAAAIAHMELCLRVLNGSQDEAAPPSPGDAVGAAQERAEPESRSTGTIWHFRCACGREHEYKRSVVTVDWLNDERARADRAERAARELAEALRRIADGDAPGVTFAEPDVTSAFARHEVLRHPQYDPAAATPQASPRSGSEPITQPQTETPDPGREGQA